MRDLTIGKFYGLQHISTRRGTFTCLALDHRQNLRHSLNPDNPASVSDADLSNFKLMVTAALAAESTAVLLDPEYSAAQAVAGGILPNPVGLVVSLEATGYSGDSKARQSRILPGWSVEKAKRMGADAVKLLVYYHPDAVNAAETEDFVGQVAEDCKALDLLIMLEPLTYALDDSGTLTLKEKRIAVIGTARKLSPLGIDILKAEFPIDIKEADQNLWLEACQELSRASVVPWILLSAAVDFETYLQQVSIACKAGASGCAVGRSVWKEAVSLDVLTRKTFLETTARERLIQLQKLCQTQAKPYTDFYTARAPLDWYKRY
ncbi:MAG: tagatose 1,6-diphosphate aldolase [Anaerolineaceae bacterium]